MFTSAPSAPTKYFLTFGGNRGIALGPAPEKHFPSRGIFIHKENLSHAAQGRATAEGKKISPIPLTRSMNKNADGLGVVDVICSTLIWPYNRACSYCNIPDRHIPLDTQKCKRDLQHIYVKKVCVKSLRKPVRWTQTLKANQHGAAATWV